MTRELRADIVIAGGGLGGVAAALAALRQGASVVLTEEYAWLGGQLTSQAVPPDEHPWVEQFGVTATYRALRDRIRQYYRDYYPLTGDARARTDLNPGAGLVSRLCAEPRVGGAVISAMLAPGLASGRLTLLQPTRPVATANDGDRVTSVTVRDLRTGDDTEISAAYVIDATETGDLLPLAGAEYVTGAESRAQTGEPSAPERANPGNLQSFAWCFVVDYVDGNHVIDRPASYSYWRSYQPAFWGAPLLSLTGPDPRTLETRTRTFTPTIDDDPAMAVADQSADPGDSELWTFRRILARKNFRPGFLASDVVLVNWPMIDYLDGSIVDVPAAERERHLRGAREQSLSLLYWLQTEAPRPDGGTGWPGLRLRGDLTDGVDGLAQAPYIREGRRIIAETTVVESDLSVKIRRDGGPVCFDDTVGIGMYRIDLHPSTGGDNYIDLPSSPFEIPLGALLPIRMENLLPGGKNIGTTHITNGAFRLHPVEWNIGEAAGALAAFCLACGQSPRSVRKSPALLSDYQCLLRRNGVELHWPRVTGS